MEYYENKGRLFQAGGHYTTVSSYQNPREEKRRTETLKACEEGFFVSYISSQLFHPSKKS